MNVIMMLSVMFLLIFLNGTILLASVTYCSNEFHKPTKQCGHADHLLLLSETQRWNKKVLHCCSRPWITSSMLP